MKEISLTQGRVALVDAEDFDFLNQWRWCTFPHGLTAYAMRSLILEGNKKKTIFMHRLLLDIPPGMETDHRDGDGLNNTRANLRACTRSQNQANGRKRKGTTSKYKGVTWCKDRDKWRAQVKQGDKVFYLGHFGNEVDAAQAYNKAASEQFGEFFRMQ